MTEVSWPPCEVTSRCDGFPPWHVPGCSYSRGTDCCSRIGRMLNLTSQCWDRKVGTDSWARASAIGSEAKEEYARDGFA